MSRSSEHDVDPQQFREQIDLSLQNIGLLGALMLMLAIECFNNDPLVPKCWGEPVLRIKRLLAWMAVGFFFCVAILSLVLAMDVGGVSNTCLMAHMSATRWAHGLPFLAVTFGIVLVAVAYGIDLGERNGCDYSVLGLVCAPLFAFVNFGIFMVLRRSRQRLSVRAKKAGKLGDGVVLGTAYFTSWNDLITQHQKKRCSFVD